MSWTLTKKLDSTVVCESRRDQEEGGGAGPSTVVSKLQLRFLKLIRRCESYNLTASRVWYPVNSCEDLR